MPVTINIDEGPGKAREIMGSIEQAEEEPVRKIMVLMSRNPNVAIKSDQLAQVSGMTLGHTIELMKKLSQANSHIIDDSRGWIWRVKKGEQMVDQEFTTEAAIIVQDVATFDIKTLPSKGNGHGTTKRQCPFCGLWFGAQGVRGHMRTCTENPNRELTFKEKQAEEKKDVQPKKRERPKKKVEQLELPEQPKVQVRESAQKLGRDVLEYMQQHEDEYITLETLHEEFPAESHRVGGLIANLAKRIPNIHRVQQGVYMFSHSEQPQKQASAAQASTAGSNSDVMRVDEKTIVVAYEGGVYLGKKMS
jgi:hypothetical protein